MRQGHRHPLRFHTTHGSLPVAFTVNLRSQISRVLWCPGWCSHRDMVEEHGDVLHSSRLYLQHEGLHGSISTEGERSSMVEDTPTAIETWPSKTCHGNCSRNGSERGIFQRNSLTVSSMSSTLSDREVVRCPSTRHVLWSFSGMLCTLTLRSLR
jgi:hypothetical protein